MVVGAAGCARSAAVVHGTSGTLRPAPDESSCEVELRGAEQLRAAGSWLKARDALSSLRARCAQERARLEPALVDVVVALEDASFGERLLSEFAAPAVAAQSPARARLKSWLATWTASQATAAHVDLRAPLQALRRARASRDPDAPQLADRVLASGVYNGELLAEIGLSRLSSSGPAAAQPYFDRARVALERETARLPTAFFMPGSLAAIRSGVWTPDAAELWLWGTAGSASLAPSPDPSFAGAAAVVFDTQTWEPTWQVRPDSRDCPSLALGQGAGFASCDGLFARDGQRLHALPELTSDTFNSIALLAGQTRLLAARAKDGQNSQLGLIDAATGTFEALPLPTVRHLQALAASPTGNWLFVESSDGVEAFAFPSLQRLLKAKARSGQALGENQIAFVADDGRLEVWQLTPARRLARHYLPEVIIPHGPALGSTYFRALDPHRLIIQHLSTEFTWGWDQAPSVLSPPNSEADELPQQELRDVSIATNSKWAAEVLHDEKLDFDELRVSATNGALLEADSLPHIRDFAVSPSGKRLALSLGERTLYVVDLDAQSRPRLLDFVHPQRLSFYDDDHLLLGGTLQSTLVDARDGSHVAYPLRRGERFFARGSSGVIVTVSPSESDCTVYAADQRILRAFHMRPLALSTSGAALLLKNDNALVFASLDEGVRAVLADSAAELERVQFSRDEHKLITLSAAGLIVWDGASRKSWLVAPRRTLGRVTALAFAEKDQVVVVGRADGAASAFRYASAEELARPPTPEADASAISWQSASHFLRAFRSRDGKWLGNLMPPSNGTLGAFQSARGELDFIGAEPKMPARCAFGNLLVDFHVCSESLRVPGLLGRLLRVDESTEL